MGQEFLFKLKRRNNTLIHKLNYIVIAVPGYTSEISENFNNEKFVSKHSNLQNTPLIN